MREGGGGGVGGGGGGGGDMSSWTAGSLPPSAASYYSYDHPSLAYRWDPVEALKLISRMGKLFSLKRESAGWCRLAWDSPVQSIRGKYLSVS